MARYNKLFTLTPYLYCENSPVIIEAGALQHDTAQNTVIAQLKFLVLDSKPLSSIKVKIVAQDNAGRSLGDPIYFTYLDIKTERQGVFGSQTPVTMPDNTTRSFTVSIVECIYQDKSVLDLSDKCLKEIPKQQEISAVLKDSLCQEYYKEKFGDCANYLYLEYKGLKICSCGTANFQSEERCTKCRTSFGELKNFDPEAFAKEAYYETGIQYMQRNDLAYYEKAIEAFNNILEDSRSTQKIKECREKIEEINTKAEADRLEKERKEEIARQEEERKVKRNRKIAIIASSIVLIATVFIFFFYAVIVPDIKYNDAIALMDSAKYDEAIKAFEAMDGYKDSVDKIDECNYNKAIALMDEQKYLEAISIFEELNGYKDSIDKIPECNYNNAIVSMNAGKYRAAISAFKKLKDYKDSQEKINECNAAIIDGKYNDAILLLDAGNVVEAYEALIALDGYKDSTEKAKSIFATYKIEKLKSAKVGDHVFFGVYEQDNNTSNGKEEIEWLVLEVTDGKALVISQYTLDCQPYNTSYANVTWENCTLRKWINNDFINTAFSAEEKAMIPTVKVSADKNPNYSTNSGNATYDQIFLLSITEVNKYFGSESEMECKPTDYVVANGEYNNSYDTGLIWWLRTPGAGQQRATRVHRSGGVDIGGSFVDDNYLVRPAMWIDLNA